MYQIHWRHRENNLRIKKLRGHGTATYPLKVAQDICTKMDKEFPYLSHWPQEAEPKSNESLDKQP